MNVLMLTSSYPIEGSNLGPFIRNLVTGLTRQGVNVGVLIFSTSKKYKVYKKDGAIIYEYPYTKMLKPRLHKNQGLIPSIKSSFLAKIQLVGYFFNTKKYLKRITKKYDIIHAHWYLPSGYIAALIKKKIHKPLITTAWGAEFHLPHNTLVRHALQFVHNKSDAVIAVSNYMRSKAGTYGLNIRTIKVIPNSVDIGQFSLPRKASKIITIATIRRLVPEKRIDDLIRAVKAMPLFLRKKTRLWIIGDGPERKKLEALAKSYGLEQYITFWGMVQHDKIPFFLSQIDIYVNPSVQEGMATANIEAMAAGCCVIAANGVGNDEVITDGVDGFLYEPRNIKQLAEKIESLIADKKLRKKLLDRGQKKIRIHFSNIDISSLYLEEYTKLVK